MKATQTWNKLKVRERSWVIDSLSREADELEFEEGDSRIVLALRVAAELLQDAVKKK